MPKGKLNYNKGLSPIKGRALELGIYTLHLDVWSMGSASCSGVSSPRGVRARVRNPYSKGARFCSISTRSLGAQMGRCVSSVCVEGSRVSTPERATQAWPIKGAEDLFVRNVFLLYFGHSSLLYPPSEQVSIWGSYGRDEARAPDLPFANAWKRWCNRSVHFFRSKNIFSTPTATCSNVVGKL